MSEVPLWFSGKTMFKKNNMTALYSVAADLSFEEYSEVVFQDNIGDKGGAIFLSGDASIVVENNTNLSFIANKATLGGGIYALPLQTHFAAYDDVCFLR